LATFLHTSLYMWKKWTQLLGLVGLAVILGSLPVKAEGLTLPLNKLHPGANKAVAGQIIVKYKGQQISTALNKRFGVAKVENLDTLAKPNLKMLEVNPEQNLTDAVKAYTADPTVEYAEPNYIFRASFYPNDPYFLPANNRLASFQWNLVRINMPQAWDLIQSAANVKVAVIDTGVAYENYTLDYNTFAKAPELTNTTFIAPYQHLSGSYYLDSNDQCNGYMLSTPIITTHANDDDGHGTHVTSTITQGMNNGQHAAGIAPNVQIMPIKIMDSNGCTNSVDIAAGIEYAISNGAKVINLSLGSGENSTTVQNAVNHALTSGVTVVAATGNDASRTNSPTIAYPAAYPGVIAVGASRYDNARAYYSQYGTGLTLLAPGGQMDSDDGTSPNDQNGDRLLDGIVAQTIKPYVYTEFTSVSEPNSLYDNWRCVTGGTFYLEDDCGVYQGTSMAAPHVTAVVALMLARNPSLTPAQIKTILTNTAQKVVIPSYNPTEHGAGLLDAYAAVVAAVSTNPTTTPTPKVGDFDNSGNKDFGDFKRLLNNFGATNCTYNLVGTSCLINLFDIGKWMKI
jgi:serine protease